jgi:hypothetical protein
MVTYRHDHGANTIADAILKSHHERPFHLYISAGRRYLEHDAPLLASIPDWALPGNTLKPDLVLILGWSADMPPPTTPTADIEFIIADVTYSRGYASAAAIALKQAKYAQLVAALRARGWSVRCVSAGTCAPAPHLRAAADNDEDASQSSSPAPAPVTALTDILVISLGSTGELYQSTRNSLRALDIDNHRIDTLLTALHHLTITHAGRIIRTRRKLDSLLRSGAPTGTG